jgi:hypothetical protein
MFYKRLCDQWENEADEAIAELERQQGRIFTDAQKAVFRARGEHRYSIPEGSRWGDVLAASTNLGETLTSGHARGGQCQRRIARRVHRGLGSARTGRQRQAAHPERIYSNNYRDYNKLLRQTH